MKCDSCFHKKICTHFIDIKNGTYGAMRYDFDTEACGDYVFVEEKKVEFKQERYVRIDKVSFYLKRLKWNNFISAEIEEILNTYMDMHTELFNACIMDGDKNE